MRFRDVSRRTAEQLGLGAPTVEFVVEGWMRVAMRLLADGHSLPTVLRTSRTKSADARLRRSRGWRRDLKIMTSYEARAALDRLTPTSLRKRSALPDLGVGRHDKRVLRSRGCERVILAGRREGPLDTAALVHEAGAPGLVAPGAQTIVAWDDVHDLTVVVWCNRLDPGAQELLPVVPAERDAFELAVRR